LLVLFGLVSAQIEHATYAAPTFFKDQNHWFNESVTGISMFLLMDIVFPYLESASFNNTVWCDSGITQQNIQVKIRFDMYTVLLIH